MIHMLKARDSAGVQTRCGETFKLKGGQTINDVDVTGVERLVTCPGCVLRISLR